MVPAAGLEPARIYGPVDFESTASTNSATLACLYIIQFTKKNVKIFFEIFLLNNLVKILVGDNMNTTEKFFEALLSTTASFFVLLILTRILGKKQMSQLTFFNYITGITIGSIAANIVTLEGKDFFLTIGSLIWWCLLTYIVDIVVIKIPKIRVVLDGEPSIVIKKGKIQYDTLKKLRLDIDNLLVLMRESEVFSITEVDYAIVEANGGLTILKKEEQKNVIKKDLNVPSPQPKYMPTHIIVEGVIIKKSLKELDLTYDWLYEQLEKSGVDKIGDVVYAEIQADGTLYVDKK